MDPKDLERASRESSRRGRKKRLFLSCSESKLKRILNEYNKKADDGGRDHGGGGRNGGKGVRVTAIKYSDTHVQKWCKKKPAVLFSNYIKKENKITKGAQPCIAKLGIGSLGSLRTSRKPRLH